MTVTQELRERYSGLWEQMVYHPFVVEMGEGTLPAGKFKRYFLQDYVFVADLVSMTANAIATAPSFDAASRLHSFLSGILDPETDLFLRAFEVLGASEEEYSSASASPTTRAFGDFLVRTGLEKPMNYSIRPCATSACFGTPRTPTFKRGLTSRCAMTENENRATKGERRENKRRKRTKMGVSGLNVRALQDIIRRRSQEITRKKKGRTKSE